MRQFTPDTVAFEAYRDYLTVLKTYFRRNPNVAYYIKSLDLDEKIKEKASEEQRKVVKKELDRLNYEHASIKTIANRQASNLGKKLEESATQENLKKLAKAVIQNTDFVCFPDSSIQSFAYNIFKDKELNCPLQSDKGHIIRDIFLNQLRMS